MPFPVAVPMIAVMFMATNILILCTHNSARSVLGEAMINHWAKRLGKDVRAFSAGSMPSGTINPMALEVLGAAGVDTVGLASKNWDVFAAGNAPPMRVVITVCDNAASEACPLWPGSPVMVHWGYADPSQASGGSTEKRREFEITRQAIGYRVLQLLALPFLSLDDASLRESLLAISQN
jgi:arsenate reductase (thioredoxin)